MEYFREISKNIVIFPKKMSNDINNEQSLNSGLQEINIDTCISL